MTRWRVELVWVPDSGELTDAVLVELSDAARHTAQDWSVARWELMRGLVLVTQVEAESCQDAAIQVCDDAIAWLTGFPAVNPGRICRWEAVTQELRELRALGGGMTINEAREASGLEPFRMLEPLPWMGLDE